MAINVTLRVPASRKALEAATTGLVALNRYVLRRSPLPPIYESGVVYKPETRRPEEWRTADVIYASGYGDCEDLASWRVAELQLAGEPAKVKVVRTGVRRFHAIVQRVNGAIEDPSKKLQR